MNNIEELIEIIKTFGGEASFNLICDEYQKKYKYAFSQSQRAAIAQLLNSDPNKVFLNSNKLWQIVVPKTTNRVVLTQQVDYKLIVCRSTYMKKYDGIMDDDKPVNGGAHVANTGHAEEQYNFRNMSGKCYGFVETKHNREGVNKKLVLENIDASYKNLDIAHNIRVVFVALNPKSKNTEVIGWYDNADVYRERQYQMVDGKERQYNIKCNYTDAHLIEEGRRSFAIPNAAQKGNKYGIGQANVWYIQRHQEANDFEKELIEYIDSLIL